MGTFIHLDEKKINKTQATENNTVSGKTLLLTFSKKTTSKLFMV